MRCIFPACDYVPWRSISKNITLHRFPEDASLRTAWLEALGKVGWDLPADSMVCSKHFMAEDFLMTRNVRKLRPDAVPLNVQLCRICFAKDCKLYPMKDRKQPDLSRPSYALAYETLTGLSIEPADKLPPYVCKRCAKRLLSCVRFRARIIRAHSIMIDIVNDYGHITLDTILDVSRLPNPNSSGSLRNESHNVSRDSNIMCTDEQDLEQGYMSYNIKAESVDILDHDVVPPIKSTNNQSCSSNVKNNPPARTVMTANYNRTNENVLCDNNDDVEIIDDSMCSNSNEGTSNNSGTKDVILQNTASKELQNTNIKGTSNNENDYGEANKRHDKDKSNKGIVKRKSKSDNFNRGRKKDGVNKKSIMDYVNRELKTVTGDRESNIKDIIRKSNKDNINRHSNKEISREPIVHTGDKELNNDHVKESIKDYVNREIVNRESKTKIIIRKRNTDDISKQSNEKSGRESTVNISDKELNHENVIEESIKNYENRESRMVTVNKESNPKNIITKRNKNDINRQSNNESRRESTVNKGDKELNNDHVIKESIKDYDNRESRTVTVNRKLHHKIIIRKRNKDDISRQSNEKSGRESTVNISDKELNHENVIEESIKNYENRESRMVTVNKESNPKNITKRNKNDINRQSNNKSRRESTVKKADKELNNDHVIKESIKDYDNRESRMVTVNRESNPKNIITERNKNDINRQSNKEFRRESTVNQDDNEIDIDHVNKEPTKNHFNKESRKLSEDVNRESDTKNITKRNKNESSSESTVNKGNKEINIDHVNKEPIKDHVYKKLRKVTEEVNRESNTKNIMELNDGINRQSNKETRRDKGYKEINNDHGNKDSDVDNHNIQDLFKDTAEHFSSDGTISPSDVIQKNKVIVTTVKEVIGTPNETNQRVDEGTRKSEGNGGLLLRFKLLSCEICNYETMNKTELMDHLQNHTATKVYNCSQCNFITTSMKYLRLHNDVNCNTENSCDVCQQKFIYKRDLKTHQRIHYGGKSYSCDVCNKKFKQYSQLTVHLRIHSGEKPYSCEVCNKSFRQKIHLQNHSRIHTGEKPYSCNVCRKSFTQRGQLQIHSLKHSTQKLYSCEECDNFFRLKSSLLMHMLSHTE